MSLIDLHRAVSEHTGEFTCERLRKPDETRVVTFKHLIQPPAPRDEAAQAAIPDVGPLRAFYATFGALMLYHDAQSGEAARYIAPPAEWASLHDGFAGWTQDLSDEERANTLPPWVEHCVVVGEVPRTGNYIVLATDGERAGQVFEFDNDGFAFTPKGKDIVAYVEQLLTPDAAALTEIASHMRFTDRNYGTQWQILEMRDNRGKHVRTLVQ
ncbi:MAG: hypothetical protein K2X78_08785 [Burkholderiaceae bacterium]|nr:hypothetical protein [Burkholderiaceae bacterium]